VNPVLPMERIESMSYVTTDRKYNIWMTNLGISSIKIFAELPQNVKSLTWGLKGAENIFKL
jgi:hypothetical protein